MNIETIILNSLEDLHKIFRGFRSHDGFGHWFRGQSNSSWSLVPKAGRPDYFLPNNRDLGRFNAWRSQAIAYSNLPSPQIEQLALAQHHGLATRLLDWTMNPLVACFFACYEHPQIDGSVYILEAPNTLATEKTTLEDLSNYKGVVGYIPNSINPRILNQKGIFTAHCDASNQITIQESLIIPNKKNLIRLDIPFSLKKDVLELLCDYGIDRSVLFPDLEGLSSHINNQTIRMNGT